MIRRSVLGAIACLFVMGCAQKESAPQSHKAKTSEAESTFYLVRHAEKTKDKTDPALTAEGQQRAQDLAQRLAKVPLTSIYSSGYIRTRDTAAPIAQAKGLEVKLYDPRDLAGFAEILKTQKGHILVVGHSNTTPQLTGLLGGEAGEPIVEATEYDRFYVLDIINNKVVSRIERYGEKA